MEIRNNDDSITTQTRDYINSFNIGQVPRIEPGTTITEVAIKTRISVGCVENKDY